MYKFVVLAAVVAVASAGVQIAAPLGYAGLAGAPLNLGYAGLPAVANLGYAAAPAQVLAAAAPAPIVAAAPAPVAYAAPAKAYAVPAPRTIPGPTLKSEVVEPVEIWGYNVEY